MNPRGPFKVGRGVTISGQVVEKVAGQDQLGKDLTASGLEIHFRAFKTRADTTFVKDVVLTKIKARNPDGTEVTETAGASGWVSGYVPAFATAMPRLICEVVLIDTGTVDAVTPSAKAELQAFEWSTQVDETAT